MSVRDIHEESGDWGILFPTRVMRKVRIIILSLVDHNSLGFGSAQDHGASLQGNSPVPPSEACDAHHLARHDDFVSVSGTASCDGDLYRVSETETGDDGYETGVHDRRGVYDACGLYRALCHPFGLLVSPAVGFDCGRV